MIIRESDTANRYEIHSTPDVCPACGKGIDPIYCYCYHFDSDGVHILRVVFRCTLTECRRLFIAKYTNTGYAHEYHLDETYILDVVKYEKFPSTIIEISKFFPIIYNQAKIAEDNGLSMICGSGYRRALEFLVKDYLVKLNPKKGEIKKLLLGEAIQLIAEDHIKQCAKRAAWLGNDETHYERIWKDKDITDLKDLIRMVVDWIDLTERSKDYAKSMPEKNVNSDR
ncbi:MAG: hypothetical protein NUV52_04170 [Candidatus Roizmanbacteria bacterium]|nr:hypothetical protein [Candidatus Roizmanbacteria bacterium]